MKNKLIKYWERKERHIINATQPEEKRIHFAQAFGALEFVMETLDNWDIEDELINLWNDEWKQRLEERVYGVL